MKKDPTQLLNIIAQAIIEKKGFNVSAFDARNISTLADYFLIAEGNVDKHVIALAKEIIKCLKEEGEIPVHVEGLDQGDWVVIDYLEMVVHLFKPGWRDKYRLEELWREAKIIDLEFALPERVK